MEDKNEWRFDRYYGENRGLDYGDLEFFKSDPNGSLAREICQNSIDAHLGEKITSHVEFKSFKVNREDIPGIDDLTKEIEECWNYKGNDEKEGAQLTKMLNMIRSKEIPCLRISDFNTTGLIGIESNKLDTPFYNLTKGSGTSNKSSGSGGSKGIGKAAAFVVSSLHTIFYSTLTKDDELGYIGISKLRSHPTKDDDTYITMGTGYYCCNNKKYSIQDELILDKNFKREKEQSGTDIYILGYELEKNWKDKIIARILESFMATFFFTDFEVRVEEIVINKKTVGNIVENDTFQNNIKNKKTRLKSILAQYYLLNNAGQEDVHIKELDIDGNKATLYVKLYNNKEKDKATKKIEMIRYPYMAITKWGQSTYFNFSALCIIEDNELNKKLRKIENPEHTKWQTNRLNSEPEEKKLVEKYLKELKDKIFDCIDELTKSGEEGAIDIEGASDYLPMIDEHGVEVSKGTAMGNKLYISPITKVNTIIPKTLKTAEENFIYDLSMGDDEFGEEEIHLLDSHHKKKKHPKNHPDDDSEVNTISGSSIGDKKILKLEPLSGMKFNCIYNNKTNKYDVFFKSLYNEEDCAFRINEYGDNTYKGKLIIRNAEFNGDECPIEEGLIRNIKIEKDKNYKLSFETKTTEKISIEVILYAYRE